MKLKVIAKNNYLHHLFRLVLITLLSMMLCGLAYAVLTLPLQSPGLNVLVMENLDKSGVSNPVTAVLLNYRGYDTLLEMAVLLLALIGVWSLCDVPERRHSILGAIQFWSRSKSLSKSLRKSPSKRIERRHSLPGPVLDVLARLLVPLLILVAGYLLWIGAHAPGGAFQAGSILGAAGVLLLLSDWHFSSHFFGLSLRIALIAGLGVFVVVGLLMVLAGSQFLEYPIPLAGALILLIEAAATLSIGFTLAALFLGGRPTTQSITKGITKIKEKQ